MSAEGLFVLMTMVVIVTTFGGALVWINARRRFP